MIGGNRSSELEDHKEERKLEGTLIQLPSYVLVPHNNAISEVHPLSIITESSKINNHSRPPRRKSIRWTQEEHRRFLLGLTIYEKGDWINISRKVVKTKTPTQIASHAQKYFIRQASHNKGKRRSIHDMILQDPVPPRIDQQNYVASPNREMQLLHEMHHLAPHNINQQLIRFHAVKKINPK